MNPEQLRRRNEAIARGKVNATETQRVDAVEAIQRELNAHPTWREGDSCEVCGEDETPDDPIAHFVHDANPEFYVMAHGQCGLDNGLRLA